MSLENRKMTIKESLKMYPELAIELSSEQVNGGIVVKFGGVSNLQKEACRIAGRELSIHPELISGYCTMLRPPLFREYTDTNISQNKWDELAGKWCEIHRMSAQELAESYVDEIKKNDNFNRINEPFVYRNTDKVWISAHDDCDYRQPCLAEEW